MKKLFLLISLVCGLPACGSLFCDSTSCGCDSPGPAGHYDIEGLHLTATERAATSAPPVVLADNATVLYDRLQLLVRPATRLVASRAAGAGWGAAWACSPVGPAFAERIDSLVITSRFAYDARHPAGASLNDLLQAQGTALTLAAYLGAQAGQPEQQLELRLLAPPEQPGPQQFDVYLRLTNGEQYRAETLRLQLTR